MRKKHTNSLEKSSFSKTDQLVVVVDEGGDFVSDPRLTPTFVQPAEKVVSDDRHSQRNRQLSSQRRRVIGDAWVRPKHFRHFPELSQLKLTRRYHSENNKETTLRTVK